jgi:hypothetical protein
MEDRRGESRRSSYLGGKIVFPNKLSTANCIVRNVSAEGFRLGIPNSLVIPDEFDLEIPQKGEHFHVRVTWRTLEEVGVAIVAPAAATAAAEDPQRRLSKLERENAELRRRLASLDSLDP